MMTITRSTVFCLGLSFPELSRSIGKSRLSLRLIHMINEYLWRRVCNYIIRLIHLYWANLCVYNPIYYKQNFYLTCKSGETQGLVCTVRSQGGDGSFYEPPEMVWMIEGEFPLESDGVYVKVALKSSIYRHRSICNFKKGKSFLSICIQSLNIIIETWAWMV